MLSLRSISKSFHGHESELQALRGNDLRLGQLPFALQEKAKMGGLPKDPIDKDKQ